jgi:hypothetical protein
MDVRAARSGDCDHDCFLRCMRKEISLSLIRGHGCVSRRYFDELIWGTGTGFHPGADVPIIGDYGQDLRCSVQKLPLPLEQPAQFMLPSNRSMHARPHACLPAPHRQAPTHVLFEPVHCYHPLLLSLTILIGCYPLRPEREDLCIGRSSMGDAVWWFARAAG